MERRSTVSFQWVMVWVWVWSCLSVCVLWFMNRSRISWTFLAGSIMERNSTVCPPQYDKHEWQLLPTIYTTVRLRLPSFRIHFQSIFPTYGCTRPISFSIVSILSCLGMRNMGLHYYSLCVFQFFPNGFQLLLQLWYFLVKDSLANCFLWGKLV